MPILHPTVRQAIEVSNRGIQVQGDDARCAALYQMDDVDFMQELGDREWSYLRAAERCVWTADQVEVAVTRGVEVTDEQHDGLMRMGYAAW